jgi:AraC-like DNA-binding protein
MQHILPGIHGFPMSQRPLLRTRKTSYAVSAIHRLVEPFRFDWAGHCPSTDIQVTGAVLERVKIFGVSHGAPVLVRSSPLRSYYLILPLQGQVTGTINRATVQAAPGEALVFPTEACLHAHWHEQCVAIVLSVAKEEFDREMRGIVTPPGTPLLPPKLDLSGGAGRSFVNVLGCLCADCDLQQFGDSSPVVRQSLQQALLLSLLQMSSGSGTRTPRLEKASTRRRRAGVARAVDYLHLNPHRKVEAQELARIAYLSLRSLQIGFLECFDMGPMTYSKRLRLMKAREELKGAEPRDTNISDVSQRWGFDCGNTFSRLYRQTFGELPSCTLAHCQPVSKTGRHELTA